MPSRTNYTNVQKVCLYSVIGVVLSKIKNWLDDYVCGVCGLISYIVLFLRALDDYGGSKLVEEAYGIVLHTYIIERQDRSITETLKFQHS